MAKASENDVRVENTRLLALVGELEDEMGQLMRATRVETAKLKSEIEHISKIASSKRGISSRVDVALKNLKKKKTQNPNKRKSVCPTCEVQNIFGMNNEILEGKNFGQASGELSKTSLQLVERDQGDVWAENARLSAQIEELKDKISQLTEVTFVEIIKLTGEVGSLWKFSQAKGLVLWNKDEVQAKLQKEKAKTFCNIPNYTLSYQPFSFEITESDFLHLLRKKITRTFIPFRKIYEVDNVFQIQPEMLADELPPYWYFFTRPGGLANQDDPFNKSLISGIWRHHGRVKVVPSIYMPLATKRTYVCGNWRLILYRLLLSVEAEAPKGYETGWAFAHLKNGIVSDT